MTRLSVNAATPTQTNLRTNACPAIAARPVRRAIQQMQLHRSQTAPLGVGLCRFRPGLRMAVVSRRAKVDRYSEGQGALPDFIPRQMMALTDEHPPRGQRADRAFLTTTRPGSKEPASCQPQSGLQRTRHRPDGQSGACLFARSVAAPLNGPASGRALKSA